MGARPQWGNQPRARAPAPQRDAGRPKPRKVSVRPGDLRSWVIATLRSRNELDRAEEAAKVNSNSGTVVDQLRSIAGREAWHEATKMAQLQQVAGHGTKPVASGIASRKKHIIKRRRSATGPDPAHGRAAGSAGAMGCQHAASTVTVVSASAAAGSLQHGLPAAGSSCAPGLGTDAPPLPLAPSPSPEGPTRGAVAGSRDAAVVGDGGAGAIAWGARAGANAAESTPLPSGMPLAAAAAYRRVRRRLAAPSTLRRPVRDTSAESAALLMHGMEQWIAAALMATARVAMRSSGPARPPATPGSSAAPRPPRTETAADAPSASGSLEASTAPGAVGAYCDPSSLAIPRPSSTTTITTAHILRWVDSGAGTLLPPAMWPTCARTRYHREALCVALQSDAPAAENACDRASDSDSVVLEGCHPRPLRADAPAVARSRGSASGCESVVVEECVVVGE